MDRSKFKKNTFMQYLLQIAKYIFPFITIPYLTRVLGPDVYAIRAYVLAAMTIMQVFLDFGFTAYGSKLIAEAKDNIDLVRTATSSIMYSKFVLCLLGSIVLFPVCLFIPILSSNIIYVYIAYIGTCFTALLPDFIFQGQENMSIITNRYVLSQIVSIILIILLIRSDADILLVPIIEAIATLVALIWSWHNAIFQHNIMFIRVHLSFILKSLKEAFIFFLSSASTVLFSSLTTLMIGIYIDDSAQISYWSIAITVISAIQSLYSPIANSLYPHMVIRKDKLLAKRILYIGTFTSILLTFFVVLFSQQIMSIIGGEAFQSGSNILTLLAPMLVFSFPSILLGYPILAACNKAKYMTLTSILASIFHIMGLFILCALDIFTITNVAILRCLTELLFMIFRFIFSFTILYGH